MKLANRVAALSGAILIPLTLFGAGKTGHKQPHWRIKGDLSEACTCSVTCGCNFGGRPSHPYCWSLASFDIQKGRYGKVKLNGLHLVRGHGKGAIVWYIDDRATPAQAAALQAIATHISGPAVQRHPSFFHFGKAHIIQEVGEKGSKVDVSGAGGFKANYTMGMDGKNPIVVENMTTWKVRHDIKGQTEWLRYKDPYGDSFDFANTSSNEGKFDWSDRTPDYL